MTLRRTAARNLRRADVGKSVIMRIGGWKTRSVFQRYDIVDNRDIADAVRKLEQNEQKQTSHVLVTFGKSETANAANPTSKPVNLLLLCQWVFWCREGGSNPHEPFKPCGF